jgi:hypothetical protein
MEYKKRVLELHKAGETSATAIAKKIVEEGLTDTPMRSVRSNVRNWIGKLTPQARSEEKVADRPFVLSAWNDSGYMMDIGQYCEHYALPRKDIRKYKLVSHTGTPFYNIEFAEKIDIEGSDIDYDLIKSVITREMKDRYVYRNVHSNINREAVLKWADLHFGAHIRNLLLTKDYDSKILEKGLLRSVAETNNFGFKKVHVHINGDLIESFSGLNHINSWMSMDPEEIGPKAVMLCTSLLHRALSKIDNLGIIKIVAGNHDRTSKANDEDVKGGAAELIAWGLQLMGYEVEFHPYVNTHLVEGINHINLHGDKGISKRSTKDIIWDYGIKGVYNFVFEAHLHSLIEKMSVSQREKFKVIRDDSIDHRRMHLQSFFTGNYYSETLNFNSNAGYCVVWDNGNGLPQVFNGCV